MKLLLTSILFVFSLKSVSQSFSERQKFYDQSFVELKGMLKDSVKLNFKRAVFVSENAYLENQGNYKEFDKHIKWLATRALLIANQNQLTYSESDKEHVQKYAAVFKLMTDSVKFYQDSTKFYATIPYKYDFDDFWGEKDWRKMFVTKLLLTNSGNCHSLPFLYKILCEEIGEKAYLSMAPNHTYIKLKCKKSGWYNTELTSGHFPIDAWIMASGYVHINAVQNRIYMDTLSDKQSIAVCLIDLAKGYEKKFGDYANPDFILNCCDLSLKYYPQYVNALILKAETMKKRFEGMMRVNGAKYPSDLFVDSDKKVLFENMQGIYAHVHELGYRKMPKEMYLNWLADLNNEREKYLNKEIQTINSKN
jgi:hypothetical protein